MAMNSETTQLPDQFDDLTPIAVTKGTTLYSYGDKCEQFVYVVSGVIRVDMASESGGRILLYRLDATDTCILTTSCLMSGDQYCAEATVEQDASIVTMSARQFFAAVDSSSTFRTFIFSSFSQRLTALLAKVDDIAFQSIERRLAGALLHHATEENVATVTHQQLAAEIGTAREVVSRKLAQWDASNLIVKGHGEIRLLAVDQLNAIA